MEQKWKENGRKENKCMEFLQILEFEEKKSGKSEVSENGKCTYFYYFLFSFFFSEFLMVM